MLFSVVFVGVMSCFAVLGCVIVSNGNEVYGRVIV